MSSTQVINIQSQQSLGKIENVLMKGDLAPLTETERLTYYKHVCDSLGLNMLTRPFDYIPLNGKLVLYASKGCAEQLRAVHKISVKIAARESIEGVYVVTADACDPSGRADSSTGAVPIQGLKGESLANAMMKAETKAKRRVTLSICGLNMLDEVEVDTIREQEKRIVPEQVAIGDGIQREGYRVAGHMPDCVKGKMIEDCSADELKEAIRELDNKYQGRGMPLGAATFIEHAKKELAAWANASGVDVKPPMEAEHAVAESVPPVCCNKTMMVSKYADKFTGEYPWYCLTCKAKKPRPA